MGVCSECWVDLRCVVQQTLLRVPESTTFRELFRKEVASKVASGDCHEESLAVSVSPTGKGRMEDSTLRKRNQSERVFWMLLH